jgi:hypothetical protein
MQQPRTSVIILTAVVLGLMVAQIAGITRFAAASEPTQPVTIHGADDETTSLIERSVARFAEADLELPNLEFFVATDEDRTACDGHKGFWHPGGSADRIDVCVATESLILHEIAHAWENHTVDDNTRIAFMALYPENEWEDESIGHLAQGIERFADSIAWGLKDRDIPEHNVDALQPRIDEFELITGTTTPRLAE